MARLTETVATEESASKTLAEEAYARIRRDIVGGELRGGEKLRLEALSKRYGIGMSPLREALARLVGDALVVTEGQRGFWVSPLSIEEFDDITRVRGLVEAEALHRAIERGGAAWEARVRDAYGRLSAVEARMQSQGGLADAFEDANQLFHEATIAACDSPWLLRMTAALYQQSARYRRISMASVAPVRSVHDEHEALAEAVLNRQALKACRLLDLHLRGTAAVVRAALAGDQSRLRVVAG